VDNRDLKPLKAFMDEHSPRSAFVVCNENARRVYEGITVIPWREFLQQLWAGEIIF